MSGDGAAAEAKARKLQEQAEWESKVVVDSVKFQSYYGPKTLTQVRSPASDATGVRAVPFATVQNSQHTKI